MSKNSAFFATAKKKDAKTDARIASCKQKLRSLYGDEMGGLDRFVPPQPRQQSLAPGGMGGSSNTRSDSGSAALEAHSPTSPRHCRSQRTTTLRETVAGRRASHKAELLCAAIEESRVLSRTWVVVDMDMFFAAVAMRDDPALRDVPMAIGGMSMISTANYKAREYVSVRACECFCVCATLLAFRRTGLPVVVHLASS